MTYIIIVLVAIVLGGALLLVGLRGVGQIGSFFEGLTGQGKSQLQSLSQMNPAEACRAWLTSGTKQSDPNTVLSLGIPDIFKPYPRWADACGTPLDVLATACRSAAEGCENGIINQDAIVYSATLRTVVRGGDIMSCCRTACGKVIEAYDRCQFESKNEAELAECFDQSMTDETRVC